MTTEAASLPPWSRASRLTWEPLSDCSAHPMDCNSRRWRLPPGSVIGGWRPLLSWRRLLPSRQSGWNWLRRSSTGRTVARWIARSLRSQPLSDLAGCSHVVLVVFQYAPPRLGAYLGSLAVHSLREPQL